VRSCANPSRVREPDKTNEPREISSSRKLLLEAWNSFLIHVDVRWSSVLGAGVVIPARSHERDL
jgi:hypothetical protein